MSVFVHSPTDDCWIWFGFVGEKFDDAPTETRPWSFDRDGENRWCVHGVCAKSIRLISFTRSLDPVVGRPCYQICTWFATVNDASGAFVITWILCRVQVRWYEKADVTRPRMYRNGSIGYGTSCDRTLTYVWGSIGLNVSLFLPTNSQKTFN